MNGERNTSREMTVPQFFSLRHRQEKTRGTQSGIVLLALITIAVATASLFVGRYALSPHQVLSLLGVGNSNVDERAEAVLFQIRLPRIAVAMLAGGALATAGAAYQGIFRNPMVSPDLLGATAGAGFGVALGLVWGLPVGVIQALAFGCGLVAVAITCIISSQLSHGKDSILVMVLSGIVVGSVFTSLIALLKTLAEPSSRLPAITFWLMGSLSGVTSSDVKLVAVPIVLGAIPLYLLRWRLNVLSLGEDEASALGVKTSRLRLATVLCSTLMTASTVAVCGSIGWVGLVIPHLARALTGPDYRTLLGASFFLGATYLLVVDNLARGFTATEIPLGILTSLVGAPFFAYLITRVKKGWAA